MEYFGDFLDTFLEGSVDHIIYRDYIVNRSSFINCSLASQLVGKSASPCQKQSVHACSGVHSMFLKLHYFAG